MLCEEIEEVLEGVVEDDLVVLPGVNGARFQGNVEWWNLGFARNGPGMELEVVGEGHGLFACLGDEGNTDDDFEFTPAVVAVSGCC